MIKSLLFSIKQKIFLQNRLSFKPFVFIYCGQLCICIHFFSHFPQTIPTLLLNYKNYVHWGAGKHVPHTDGPSGRINLDDQDWQQAPSSTEPVCTSTLTQEKRTKIHFVLLCCMRNTQLVSPNLPTYLCSQSAVKVKVQEKLHSLGYTN